MSASSSSDDADLASSDEMKVFKDEGEEAEERRSSADGCDDDPIDVMDDLKRDLIDEGEKHTPTEPTGSSTIGPHAAVRSPIPAFASSSTAPHHLHHAQHFPYFHPFHHQTNGSLSMEKMASIIGQGSPYFMKWHNPPPEDFRQPPRAHMNSLCQRPELQRPMLPPPSQQYPNFWPFTGMYPYAGYALPRSPLPLFGLNTPTSLHSPYSPHHPLSPHSASQPNGHLHHPLLPSTASCSSSSSDQKPSPHSSLSRMSNGTSASSAGTGSPSSASASRSIASPGSDCKSKIGINGISSLNRHHHLSSSNSRLNHLNHNNSSNSSVGSVHHLNGESKPGIRMDESRSNSNNMGHIKKPLNAFMLYMKEQRAKVVAEYTLKESAAINQILGKKWHNLAREEQSKYYEMARNERILHQQRHPGWTARDNYAINQKKKKKKRDKSADGDGGSLKKCRARFGLDQQNKWCKPCRRKKKCARYSEGLERNSNGERDNLGSVGSTEAATPDSKSANESDADNMNLSSNELSLSSPPVPNGDSHLLLPPHSSNGHLSHLSHHQRLLQMHHHEYRNSNSNNMSTSSSSSSSLASLSCPPRNSPIGPNNPLSIEQLTRPHRPIIQSS